MAKRGRGGSRERSNDSRGIMAFIIMALACSFVVVWALQCCIHSVSVCVCDYTYTNKQCHTHCSSTVGAAAATAVVVVVLVGIFGLQSSFDCFSLCH